MEGVVNLGRDALKTVLLINGGAAIAVLALIGQVASKSPKELIAALAPVLAWFAIGVAVCGAATVFAFIATLLLNTMFLIVEDDGVAQTVVDAQKGLPTAGWARTIARMGYAGMAMLFTTMAGALLGCFCFARGAFVAVETLRTFPW